MVADYGPYPILPARCSNSPCPLMAPLLYERTRLFPLQEHCWIVGETVRRERRWTSAGATPARELDRSSAAPVYSATSRQNEKSRCLSLLRTLPRSSGNVSLPFPVLVLEGGSVRSLHRCTDAARTKLN